MSLRLSQNHEKAWWHRLPAWARHRQDAGATKNFLEQELWIQRGSQTGG
jgi:hypothetical protein